MGKDRNTEEFGRPGEDGRETPDCPGHKDVGRPAREGDAAGRRAAGEAPAAEETGRESEG